MFASCPRCMQFSRFVGFLRIARNVKTTCVSRFSCYFVCVLRMYSEGTVLMHSAVCMYTPRGVVCTQQCTVARLLCICTVLHNVTLLRLYYTVSICLRALICTMLLSAIVRTCTVCIILCVLLCTMLLLSNNNAAALLVQ